MNLQKNKQNLLSARDDGRVIVSEMEFTGSHPVHVEGAVRDPDWEMAGLRLLCPLTLTHAIDADSNCKVVT